MRLPLLFLHIAGGMFGLLSGAIAMVYRKGSRGHRIAGNVFVVSMLIMGASASYLAFMKHETENFFGGLLTLYMIATAWSTARRSGETSLYDWSAFTFAVSIAASLLIRSVLVARGLAARQPGVPLGIYFFTAAIPLLAATGDLRMLLRGGIDGTPRIARHLWRMCYGLFIASGSFFLGKQQFFPAAVRKQYLLVPLAILPLVLLIYWLVRIRFKAGGKAFKLVEQRDLRRAV